MNSYQVQINQIGPAYRAWLTDLIEPVIDGNAPWLKNKDVEYQVETMKIQIALILRKFFARKI